MARTETLTRFSRFLLVTLLAAEPSGGEQMSASESTFERHFSVDQLAELWGMSDDSSDAYSSTSMAWSSSITTGRAGACIGRCGFRSRWRSAFTRGCARSGEAFLPFQFRSSTPVFERIQRFKPIENRPNYRYLRSGTFRIPPSPKPNNSGVPTSGATDLNARLRGNLAGSQLTDHELDEFVRRALGHAV